VITSYATQDLSADTLEDVLDTLRENEGSLTLAWKHWLKRGLVALVKTTRGGIALFSLWGNVCRSSDKRRDIASGALNNPGLEYVRW
jgi:hypothetical protein